MTGTHVYRGGDIGETDILTVVRPYKLDSPDHPVPPGRALSYLIGRGLDRRATIEQPTKLNRDTSVDHALKFVVRASGRRERRKKRRDIPQASGWPEWLNQPTTETRPNPRIVNEFRTDDQDNLTNRPIKALIIMNIVAPAKPDPSRFKILNDLINPQPQPPFQDETNFHFGMPMGHEINPLTLPARQGNILAVLTMFGYWTHSMNYTSAAQKPQEMSEHRQKTARVGFENAIYFVL